MLDERPEGAARPTSRNSGSPSPAAQPMPSAKRTACRRAPAQYAGSQACAALSQVPLRSETTGRRGACSGIVATTAAVKRSQDRLHHRRMESAARCAAGGWLAASIEPSPAGGDCLGSDPEGRSGRARSPWPAPDRGLRDRRGRFPAGRRRACCQPASPASRRPRAATSLTSARFITSARQSAGLADAVADHRHRRMPQLIHWRASAYSMTNSAGWTIQVCCSAAALASPAGQIRRRDRGRRRGIRISAQWLTSARQQRLGV